MIIFKQCYNMLNTKSSYLNPGPPDDKTSALTTRLLHCKRTQKVLNCRVPTHLCMQNYFPKPLYFFSGLKVMSQMMHKIVMSGARVGREFS